MAQPKAVSSLRRYAIFYGAGGIAALTAMRYELFTFPEGWKLYINQGLSMITILCVFLAGPGLIDLVRKTNEIVRKMNELDEKDDDTVSDAPRSAKSNDDLVLNEK